MEPLHTYENTLKTEQRRLILSAAYPVIFVVLLWIVKSVEVVADISLSHWGLAPRSLEGLTGILFYPLLHSDLSHLFSNSLPLLFLGSALFYYYRQQALGIFFQLYLISGIWLWFLGRDGTMHIGASGLVYGLAAFHFTAGLIKRNMRLLAFSLLVTFLYGSIVWGIIPSFHPHRNISWEGHLTGMVAGVVLAIWHREKGPQRDRYEWDDDDPESESDSNDEQIENSDPENTETHQR